MRKPTLYIHRDTWYARFWIPEEKKYRSKSLGIPMDGKPRRRDEATEKAIRISIEFEKQALEPAVQADSLASYPLLEYVESFWQPDSDYVKEKALVDLMPISAHYLLSNRRLVELKMKPFPGFANMTLGSLSKSTLRKWKLWLAEQGYSGRVINSALLALRVPIKRAFGDDLIPTDPFAGVTRASHKEKRRGILTPNEIKRLLETPIKDPRSRLSIYLPLYCSMRMGEVRGLLWGDISDGIIHIRNNWQEGEGLKGCKCGSEGYVPMPRIVADLVSQVYTIAPLTGPNDYVMSVQPNRPIHRETLTRALKTELLSIGITEEQRKERNIVYHSLRHSFVTACRIAGLSDFETMTLSRHKDARMLERYSHGKEALDVRSVGEKFEQYFLPQGATQNSPP